MMSISTLASIGLAKSSDTWSHMGKLFTVDQEFGPNYDLLNSNTHNVYIWAFNIKLLIFRPMFQIFAQVIIYFKLNTTLGILY